MPPKLHPETPSTGWPQLTAPELAAARTILLARVVHLQAKGVQPKNIEPVALTANFGTILGKVLPHAAAFAEQDVTAAVVGAVTAIVVEFDALVAKLPPDQRRMRRRSADDLALIADANALLTRYTTYLRHKARGAAMREEAQLMGLGVKRGQSLRAVEESFRAVVTDAKDATRCALFGVKPAQIAALTAMHGKLLAALPASGKRSSENLEALNTLDRLQLAIEVFYDDIAAAASWCLGGDERKQLVKALPKAEALGGGAAVVGKAGVADVAGGEDAAGESAEPGEEGGEA